MSMWRYQERIQNWMQECFGTAVSRNQQERNFRFLEEALELVQANGCTKEEAIQQLEYTFGRPPGVIAQEVGGVMVTLAALCSAVGVDLDTVAHDELKRINTPEFMVKLRAKQASKPSRNGPLPGSAT